MNVFGLIAKGFNKIASGIKKGVEKVAKKVKDTVIDLVKDKEKEPSKTKYTSDSIQDNDVNEDVNYYIDKYLSKLSDKKKEDFKNEYENYMADSARLNILYNESNLSELYYGETNVEWGAVEDKINNILNERTEFNQEELLQNIGDNLYDTIKNME
jgi:hypothetical protein